MSTSTRRLPDQVVLRGITRTLLGRQVRSAIIACALRGYGEARNLLGIVTIAKEHRAKPRAVAAAFGFLPSASNHRKYLDVWSANDDFAMPLLPTDIEVVAAFALSRAIHDGGGPFMVD